jgi:hypothetical protein
MAFGLRGAPRARFIAVLQLAAIYAAFASIATIDEHQ